MARVRGGTRDGWGWSRGGTRYGWSRPRGGGGGRWRPRQQGFNQRVCSMSTEFSGKVIQVQGPDHPSSKTIVPHPVSLNQSIVYFNKTHF